MNQAQVTFRGMAPTAALEEAALRAAGALGQAGVRWHLTFEKPAALSPCDELWLHLDVQAPGRHVSITRTRPLGCDPRLDPTEEFVRQTFVGARRALSPSPAEVAARYTPSREFLAA